MQRIEGSGPAAGGEGVEPGYHKWAAPYLGNPPSAASVLGETLSPPNDSGKRRCGHGFCV